MYSKASRPKAIYTNPVFGKIERPVLKDSSTSAGLNFVLDTIEGEPITASETAKVIFLPPSTTRFGYREKIYLMAKTLGFDTEKVKHKINGKEAVFDDGRAKLTIDITNFNFSYEYKYERNPLIFSSTVIPSKKEVENRAVDFVKTLGRYPDELAKGKVNTILLNYNYPRNTLYVASRPQEANVVEVDFYPPDIEQYPVVSPKYFNSQDYVIMVFYESGYKVLKAQIRFHERSAEQFGIYPVKTGTEAWEDLKAGWAMVVSRAEDKNDILIKKMFMGYLNVDLYQNYLQPVYVFLGDNNFVAYVPAVSGSFLME
jgi:hypothetical protein